jgi:hypothetical protein
VHKNFKANVKLLQFGGRLVQFSSADPGKVTLSQVVCNPELLQRATRLETAVSQGDYVSFCQEQAAAASKSEMGLLWKYLGAQFDAHPQAATLALLGYPLEQLNSSLDALLAKDFNQLSTNVSLYLISLAFFLYFLSILGRPTFYIIGQ